MNRKQFLTGFPCLTEQILNILNGISNKLYQFRALYVFSIVHFAIHFIALHRYSTLLPNYSLHEYHSKTI